MRGSRGVLAVRHRRRGDAPFRRAARCVGRDLKDLTEDFLRGGSRIDPAATSFIGGVFMVPQLTVAPPPMEMPRGNERAAGRREGRRMFWLSLSACAKNNNVGEWPTPLRNAVSDPPQPAEGAPSRSVTLLVQRGRRLLLDYLFGQPARSP